MIRGRAIAIGTPASVRARRAESIPVGARLSRSRRSAPTWTRRRTRTSAGSSRAASCRRATPCASRSSSTTSGSATPSPRDGQPDRADDGNRRLPVGAVAQAGADRRARARPSTPREIDRPQHRAAHRRVGIDGAGRAAAAASRPRSRMFVDTLRPDDRLAIVTYAGTSGVALPSTPVAAARRDSARDREPQRRRIDQRRRRG